MAWKPSNLRELEVAAEKPSKIPVETYRNVLEIIPIAVHVHRCFATEYE